MLASNLINLFPVINNMAVRQRGSQRKSEETRLQNGGEKKVRKGLENTRSDTLVMALLLYLLAIILLTLTSYYHLPEPSLTLDGNTFSTINARRHLRAITNIGIRPAGSENNDILTRDVILNAIKEIQLIATPQVEIEVDVQHVSGHFHLDFLGGMTHLYDNLTNVVVRFSRKHQPQYHALLVNCHFDSSIGSPAASDDASSCAILLEVLRSLSVGPNPSLLKYPVIFLFNGAEEMVLPASHGFITKHPWSKQVKAFLNLEAAGAGGKEIVFQTGPNHPWLARIYAKVVPHPCASVMAQEIFQAGVIPSDTDFRIFRDFGGIPGIDMAYFVNGYVYHNEYDTADRIPDGSIQRAGDNILALVKEIANSDQLVDPGDDKHGKIVYFDVLGLFSVAYPERMGLILNYGTIALTIIGFLVGTRRLEKEVCGSRILILKSIFIILLSQIVGIILATSTGIVTTIMKQTLSFYAHPLIVIPLFYMPSILGMALVHYWWRNKYLLYNGEQMEQIIMHSNQFVWWGVLLITTYLRLSSAFVPFLLLIFPLVFRTFLWDILLKPLISKLKFPTLYKNGFIICYGLAMLPLLLSFLLVYSIMDLFIPLMGRSGSIVSPDVVIAIISASLTCLVLQYIIPTLVHLCTKQFAKVAGLLLTAIWLLTLLSVIAGLVFPFSGKEPIRPKRFFLQHSHVRYHDNSQESFSGIYVHTLDYRELDPLIQMVPTLKEAQEVECKGLYCGLPSYLPVAHMMKRNWILPAPPPSGQSAILELDNIQTTAHNTKNYSFVAKFPVNARLHLQPLSNLRLQSWSLESFIPKKTPYGSEGQGCYYILYTRGIGNGTTRFWIELEGDGGSPALEIAVIAVYVNPPLSVTPSLEKLMGDFPDWVTTIAWTSVMDVWKF